VKNCEPEGNSVLLKNENEKMGDKKERFTSPIKSRQFKSSREGNKKRGDDLLLPSRREKKRSTKDISFLTHTNIQRYKVK